MSKTPRALLFGLDGATFDLLDPWMEDGFLPNLRRLSTEGVRGALTSTRPPTTAPAWVACLTGTNPGQHGVFDFRESPLLDPQRPLISSRSVRAPALWQILNHHGRQVGLLNVPVSYPPAPVDGFIVGGMMSPGPQSQFAHPPGLRDELHARGYVIDVEIQKYDVEAEADAMRFLDDVQAALEKRAEALFHLMDTHSWQFLMAVFVAADRIQHLFWKTIADPDSQFYHGPRAAQLRTRILEIYQALDEVVGQIMARVDADGGIDLFIVSDHGFGSTKAWINVNRWLQEQGWQRLKPASALRKRLFYEMMKLNDSGLVKALLPESLGRAVRARVRGGRSVFKTDLDQCIDWERTQAFFASIPAQGIYVNVKRNSIGPKGAAPGQAARQEPVGETVGTVEPGIEHQGLRREIRNRLLDLRDPRSGDRVVDEVWFREEIYHGPYTHLAPDLLFVACDYSYLGRELLGTRDVIETSMNWANGFHRMDGILMAYGPRIQSGLRVEGASMVDIAPTLLYDLGLPVPTNMDGRVLTELMDPGFVKRNEIRYEAPLDGGDLGGSSYTEQEQNDVSGRLAALGYIE